MPLTQKPPHGIVTTNHTVTIHNRFGNNVIAPVVYVNDLGEGRATVHVETNYHIEDGHA